MPTIQPRDENKFTLWSRNGSSRPIGPWELEATHRHERLEELLAKINKSDATKELVILPPDETP